MTSISAPPGPARRASCTCSTNRPSVPGLQGGRELCIDNLLVRIHFMIMMIRWTGLASWELKFLFPGRTYVSATAPAGISHPIQELHRTCAMNRPSVPGLRGEREFFIDNLLVRIQFIIVMIRWTGLRGTYVSAPAPAVTSQTVQDLHRTCAMDRPSAPGLRAPSPNGSL